MVGESSDASRTVALVHPGAGRSWPNLSIFVLGDALAVLSAMIAAYWGRDALSGFDGSDAETVRHARAVVCAVIAWPLALAHQGLYRRRYTWGRLTVARRIGSATMHATLAIAVLSYAFRLEISRGWLLVTAVLGLTMLLAERELMRQWIVRCRHQGRYLVPAIVIGHNDEAHAVASKLRSDSALGYLVMSVVGDVAASPTVNAVQGPTTGTDLVVDADGGSNATPDLTVNRVIEAVHSHGATSVVIATTSIDLETTNRLTRILAEAGVDVELTSSLRDISPRRMTLRPLGPFAVVSIDRVNRHGWRMVAKRAFDLGLAVGGLIALSPVMLATAAAVKLDSRGPVLFRQIRVGKDGRPFLIYKFRSMVAEAELILPELEALNAREGPLFKIPDDPRTTRVGRFIRRTSIDELPQLWNVVNSTMSIVGPRPALPSEAEQWPEALKQRLRVKPGITGYWQVSGRDSDSFELYSRLDLYYVDNWSLITDVAIVLKTLPTLVSRRSAA